MRNFTSLLLSLGLSLLVGAAAEAQPGHGHRPQAGPRCPGGKWSTTHHRCVRPTACADGWKWSVYYERCVQREKSCPEGTQFTGHGCTPWQKCPTGQYYNEARKRCMPDLNPCPHGYRYRGGWGCQPQCPSGYYLNEGSCEKVEKPCPPGQMYVHERGRCVPNCRPGMYWDYRAKACKRKGW